jgi:hypothetical protein
LSRVAVGKSRFRHYNFESKDSDSAWQWMNQTENNRVRFGGAQDPGLDGGRAHYMVKVSRQCNPEYIVVYRYPDAFCVAAPWCLPESDQIGEVNYCSYHKMKHGDFLSCDSELGKMSCA